MHISAQSLPRHPTCSFLFSFFFFNDTPTTEIYTLSLHDALPISNEQCHNRRETGGERNHDASAPGPAQDRKSTRLNSSHITISYAVFCLKKKKNKKGLSRLHVKANSCDTLIEPRTD